MIGTTARKRSNSWPATCGFTAQEVERLHRGHLLGSRAGEELVDRAAFAVSQRPDASMKPFGKLDGQLSYGLRLSLMIFRKSRGVTASMPNCFASAEIPCIMGDNVLTIAGERQLHNHIIVWIGRNGTKESRRPASCNRASLARNRRKPRRFRGSLWRQTLGPREDIPRSGIQGGR